MELDSDGVVAVSQTEVGFEVLWIFGRHSKFRLRLPPAEFKFMRPVPLAVRTRRPGGLGSA